MEIVSTIAATCLALNIYMEARSEPLDGQFAVAQVTVRRADYRSDNVCRVVTRRGQFSWTRGTDGNGSRKFEEDSWKSAINIARRTLLWGYLHHFDDRSKGATHYATVGINPYWAKDMEITAKIGRHIFYRKKD